MDLQGCFECSGWLNVSNFKRQRIPDRRSSIEKQAMFKCFKCRLVWKKNCFSFCVTFPPLGCSYWSLWLYTGSTQSVNDRWWCSSSLCTVSIVKFMKMHKVLLTSGDVHPCYVQMSILKFIETHMMLLINTCVHPHSYTGVIAKVCRDLQ